MSNFIFWKGNQSILLTSGGRFGTLHLTKAEFDQFPQVTHEAIEAFVEAVTLQDPEKRKEKIKTGLSKMFSAHQQEKPSKDSKSFSFCPPVAPKPATLKKTVEATQQAFNSYGIPRPPVAPKPATLKRTVEATQPTSVPTPNGSQLKYPPASGTHHFSLGGYKADILLYFPSEFKRDFLANFDHESGTADFILNFCRPQPITDYFSRSIYFESNFPLETFLLIKSNKISEATSKPTFKAYLKHIHYDNHLGTKGNATFFAINKYYLTTTKKYPQTVTVSSKMIKVFPDTGNLRSADHHGVQKISDLPNNYTDGIRWPENNYPGTSQEIPAMVNNQECLQRFNRFHSLLSAPEYRKR